MTLKSKADSNYYDKTRMYAWVFENGAMIILNEETYKITLRQNYFHREKNYGIDIIENRKADYNEKQKH